MRKIRHSLIAGSGALMLGLALLLPTSATAQESSAPAGQAPASQAEVISGRLAIDCSTFTEQDRQRAVHENLNICGSLEGSGQALPVETRASTVGDCGVSSIYVEKWGSKLRISYGMHSTMGVIVTRSLTATWGPTAAGSNYDLGAVGSETYTNSVYSSGFTSGTKAGGTLRGTVTIAGWTFSCSVLADDPVHTL